MMFCITSARPSARTPGVRGLGTSQRASVPAQAFFEITAFMCAKLLRFIGVHPNERRLPGVDRVLRYAALAGHVVRRPPSVRRLQCRNNLRSLCLLPLMPDIPQSEIIPAYVRIQGGTSACCAE